MNISKVILSVLTVFFVTALATQVLAIDTVAPQPVKKPYVMSYSIPDAINLTKAFADKGEISNDGVANSLIKKLEQAQDKITTNKNVSRNMIEAALHEVEAQSGAHITERTATFLTGYLTTLLRYI